MTQDVFIKRRKEEWDKIEAHINRSTKGLKNNAGWFPKAFRELTQDLNTARSNAFEPSIIERLNRLVMEGSQLIYGGHKWSVKALVRFLVFVFPNAVRSNWKAIAAAHLLFYGLAVFNALLVFRFPDLVYEILPESVVHDMREMYDPSGEHFLQERSMGSNADMFGFYILNNISIAFRTYAGGILLGFGSILILCFNAVFLGAVSGHIVEQGFSGTFFPFVIGHSSLELTAIVFSAYAGLKMGFSVFVTRGLKRSASLRKAADDGLPIIAGSALMLTAAAAVEAFWSSRHLLPAAVKYSAGGAGWILLLCYFIFCGRRREG